MPGKLSSVGVQLLRGEVLSNLHWNTCGVSLWVQHVPTNKAVSDEVVLKLEAYALTQCSTPKQFALLKLSPSTVHSLGNNAWKTIMKSEYVSELLLWNRYLLWSRITQDQWRRKVLFSHMLWLLTFTVQKKIKFTTQNISNKKSLDIFLLNKLDLAIIVFNTTT